VRAEDIAGEHEDTDIGILLSFWNAARGSNRFPSQTDLDLATIPRLAPHVFILDAEDNSVFRYRYLGTAIDAHFGVNLTGHTFDEFRSGRVLDEITTFFKQIMDTSSMGILTTQLPSETNDAITYTRVGLPVADDHQSPNKILGLLLFHLPDTNVQYEETSYDLENEDIGVVNAVYGEL